MFSGAPTKPRGLLGIPWDHPLKLKTTQISMFLGSISGACAENIVNYDVFSTSRVFRGPHGTPLDLHCGLRGTSWGPPGGQVGFGPLLKPHFEVHTTQKRLKKKTLNFTTFSARCIWSPSGSSRTNEHKTN